MAKIHTHYDNLKVARMAPPEVIRAAYKALSQKYHPDKNPGDEKAARIMAILNSAYGTLADPQRRKEHDEWIAAEEWEIEWLESTHQEEHRGKPRNEPYQPDAPPPAAPPYRRWRDWMWWFGLLCCLGLGWLGALLTQARAVSATPLEAAARVLQEGRVDARTVAKADPKVEADPWASGKVYFPEAPPAAPAAPAPEVKVLAVSQLLLPAATPALPACDADGKAALAPNGEPWPLRSGYIEGFPVGNKGAELELALDNANNNAPVFIKLYDLERHANVRYLYILAHDKLTVEQLAFGKYEVHYQRVEAGGEACPAAPAR